jgi:hypothetical protein
MELKDFLSSINTTKQNLIDSDPKAEKLYLPFIVNKCLSYFPDTIMAVNEVNCLGFADKKMQYDYLLNAIRAKKRFAPWQKKIQDADVDLVKQAYSLSEKKALELLPLLSPEKLETIRKTQFTGGHK